MRKYNDECRPRSARECRYCGQRSPCQCGHATRGEKEQEKDPIAEMLIASMRHTRRTFEEARRIALGQ